MKSCGGKKKKKIEVYKKFPEVSRLWQHIAVGNALRLCLRLRSCREKVLERILGSTKTVNSLAQSPS